MTDDAIQSAKQSLATLTVGNTGLSMTDLATVFVKSGFFKDVREQAQAVVKVLLGQELGLQPIQAMMGIHIVEGKPEISAALMAALVKRSGRYDYEVKHHDDEGCAIEFFALVDGKRVPCGVSEFTMHDAQRAGLANRQNWKGYPRNMCFARAMSNGVKWYCGDAVGGLPIYTDGEISDAVNGQRPAEGKAAPEIADPRPLSAPQDADNPYAPKQIDKPPVPESKPADPQARASDPPASAVSGTGSTKRNKKVPVPPTSGDSDMLELVRAEETAGPQTDHEVQDAIRDAADAAPAGRQVFMIGGNHYDTAGITEAQMRRSHLLATEVDKKLGKGFARVLLARQQGVKPEAASRNNLTEAEATVFLAELEKALAGVKR